MSFERKSFSNLLPIGLALYLAPFVGVGLLGCSQSRPSEDGPAAPETGVFPAPEHQAAGNMGQSFRLLGESRSLADGETPSSSDAEAMRVAIQENALGKEFLFQSSLISQVGMQAWQGKKSRVVRFKRVGNSLNMLEAPDGNTRTNALPAYLLLAQFPIVETDGGWIAFDFPEGMARLLIADDWYGSDYGSGYEPGLQNLPVEISYIEDATVDADKLLIDQVALVNRGDTAEPLLLRTWLTPYQPDPSYTPAPRSDYNRLGFFETAPRLPLHSGEEIIHATRFHPERPLVFAVSANTPEDYKQAMKDGVLYWNSVLGRDWIQVIDAPEGVTAPSFEHNVVQWIEDDDAGFAFADAQMDPRTGQILHAHVYMTSVFAFGGKQRARELLRLLSEGNEATTSQGTLRTPGLRGFSSSLRCARPFAERIQRDLALFLASDVQEATILKASQDYVREVVAHEVGHVLGLRHNFAGSLGSNYDPTARPAIQKQYLEAGGRAPDSLISTSSVMEYSAFLESVITGDHISRQVAALPYDVAAIKALYDEEFPSDPTKAPLFCTDSHAESGYADCVRFDVGSNPVEQAFAAKQSSFEETAKLFLSAFVSHIAPPQGTRPGTVENFEYPLESLAVSLLGYQSGVLTAFTGDTRLIQVERAYPHVRDIDSESLLQETDALLLSEIDRFGGLGALLSQPEGSLSRRFADELKLLVRSEAYRNLPVDSASSRTLSEQDIAAFDRYVDRIAEKLPEALQVADIVTLSRAADLRPAALTPASQSLFETRLESVLFETSGTLTGTRTQDDGVVETLNLAAFSNAFDTRLAALELLGVAAKAPEWALAPASRIRKKLEDLANKQLGLPLDAVDASEYSQDLSRWILEVQHLRNRLRLFEDSSVLEGG